MSHAWVKEWSGLKLGGKSEAIEEGSSGQWWQVELQGVQVPGWGGAFHTFQS